LTDVPAPSRRRSPSRPGPRPQATREVDLPTRWLYGFGSVAFGVKDNGFSYFLVFFYNQVMGVPAQAIALADSSRCCSTPASTR